MRGSIARRGRESWRLRFDVGVDATGRRKVASVTVRGTKRQAEAKLRELLGTIDDGSFVERSKITVAEQVRARVTQWSAAGEIGAKTAERYCEFVEHQIVPHLGAKPLQSLKVLDIERWHAALRMGDGRRKGLGARTIGHAHRLLSKALKEAVKHGLLVRNVAGRDGQRAPKADAPEIEILAAEQIGDVVAKLRGRPIYAKAIVALFTGARRGEILALRWSDVDLVAKTMKICASLEDTKAGGAKFKMTKTKNGLRDVSLPDVVVDALAEHRRQQLEQRMAMGLGRPADDALIFSAIDGGPLLPRNLTYEWMATAGSIGLKGISFHALRHTHASQLIDAGVDVVRIAKRLGHASPTITLQVYAHLFRKRDDLSAEVINAAIAGSLVTRS
jgi:integrase